MKKTTKIISIILTLVLMFLLMGNDAHDACGRTIMSKRDYFKVITLKNFRVEYYQLNNLSTGTKFYYAEIRDNGNFAHKSWHESDGIITSKKDWKTFRNRNKLLVADSLPGDIYISPFYSANESYKKFNFDEWTKTEIEYLGRPAIEYTLVSTSGNGYTATIIMDKEYNVCLADYNNKKDENFDRVSLKVTFFEVGGQTMPK